MIASRWIALAATGMVALACSPKPSAPEVETSSPTAAVARFASSPEGTPDGGAAALEVKSAGKVMLRDGRLAVSDAFINDAPVVASDLPQGEFTVELLVAKSRTDSRIAAARVVLGNDSIAAWRRIGVIPIDSGTGAFFDPRMFSGHGPADVETFNGQLLELLKPSNAQPYSSAMMTWRNGTLVAFSTGFGDGTYPVYLGSSSAGRPVGVVVDFEVLPWEERRFGVHAASAGG